MHKCASQLSVRDSPLSADDVLTSRVHARAPRVQTVLSELLDTVVSAYSSMALPGVRLFYTLPHAVPDTVFIDPLRIRQIIANGVTNALKQTVAGEVQIHVRAPRCYTMGVPRVTPVRIQAGSVVMPRGCLSRNVTVC